MRMVTLLVWAFVGNNLFAEYHAGRWAGKTEDPAERLRRLEPARPQVADSLSRYRAMVRHGGIDDIVSVLRNITEIVSEHCRNVPDNMLTDAVGDCRRTTRNRIRNEVYQRLIDYFGGNWNVFHQFPGGNWLDRNGGWSIIHTQHPLRLYCRNFVGGDEQTCLEGVMIIVFHRARQSGMGTNAQIQAGPASDYCQRECRFHLITRLPGLNNFDQFNQCVADCLRRLGR